MFVLQCCTVQYSTVLCNAEAENESPWPGRAGASVTTSCKNQDMRSGQPTLLETKQHEQKRTKIDLQILMG